MAELSGLGLPVDSALRALNDGQLQDLAERLAALMEISGVSSWDELTGKPSALAALAALTPQSNRIAVYSGEDAAALQEVSAAGLALAAAANVSAMRVLLELDFFGANPLAIKAIPFGNGATITSGTTPDFANLSDATITMAAPTTVTAFQNGVAGQEVRAVFGAANCTLTHHATNLILRGGVDRTPAAGDVITFRCVAAGQWREVAAAGVTTQAMVSGLVDALSAKLATAALGSTLGGLITSGRFLRSTGSGIEGVASTVLSTVTALLEKRRTAGGVLYDPAIVAAAEATTDLGEIAAPTWTPNGNNGRSQVVTATAALSVDGMTNPHIGRTNRLCVFGGADGLTISISRFNLGPNVSATAFPLDAGETLVLFVEAEQIGGETYLNLDKAVVFPAPTPAGIEIESATITPAVGASGAAFRFDYTWTGFPKPTTEDIVWTINGDTISGATSLLEVITAAGGGRIRGEIDSGNGFGSDTAVAEARIGPIQPSEIAADVILANDTASQITNGVIDIPAECVEGDYVHLVGASQNTADATLPTGFALVQPEIGRPSSEVGANYRTIVAGKFLTAADILAGQFTSVTVRAGSMWVAKFLRDVAPVGGVNWDGTAERDATAPTLEHNSTPVPDITAGVPHLSVVSVLGGSYNVNVKLVTLSGWTAGATTTFGSDTGRVGVKNFTRERGAGTISPPDASHGGSAIYNLTAVHTWFRGPDDA